MQEIFIGNIRGPKGDTGNGLTIKEFYSTIDELPDNPSVGDAYGVGEEGAYEIYIYSATKGWVNSGAFQPDINEQAPNYDEATTLESLSSGEKISLAFGKIKKAIKELISHLADGVKHITSAERTTWNGKAPGGHGLGGVGAARQHVPFIDVMHDGSGFYQVACEQDSPNSLAGWMALLQIVRNPNDDAENGVQLAFNDYETVPYMWLRTLIRGKGTDWVEMLHTGNIGNHASQTVTGTYTGNGNFGDGYPNQIPITASTKVVIINMESDAESGSVAGATATFIRGSKIGMAFVTAGSEYPHYGRLSLNWDNGYLTWYAVKTGTNTIQDSSTQLNVKNAKYSYIRID